MGATKAKDDSLNLFLVSPELGAQLLGTTPADLDCYVGSYTSPQIPLKITVSREGNVLKAQATGQPAFALDAMSKDVFKFDPVSVRVEFDAANPTFTTKQGGASLQFTKEWQPAGGVSGESGNGAAPTRRPPPTAAPELLC